VSERGIIVIHKNPLNAHPASEGLFSPEYHKLQVRPVLELTWPPRLMFWNMV
jgi:hypothetical protein